MDRELKKLMKNPEEKASEQFEKLKEERKSVLRDTLRASERETKPTHRVGKIKTFPKAEHSDSSEDINEEMKEENEIEFLKHSQSSGEKEESASDSGLSSEDLPEEPLFPLRKNSYHEVEGSDISRMSDMSELKMTPVKFPEEMW